MTHSPHLLVSPPQHYPLQHPVAYAGAATPNPLVGRINNNDSHSTNNPAAAVPYPHSPNPDPLWLTAPHVSPNRAVAFDPAAPSLAIPCVGPNDPNKQGRPLPRQHRGEKRTANKIFDDGRPFPEPALFAELLTEPSDAGDGYDSLGFDDNSAAYVDETTTMYEV